MLKPILLLIAAAAFLVQSAQVSGAAPPARQNSPEVVPMDKEPHHHVLFRNEFIEVIHATIPPGESTLFHTHSHDSVGFDLAQSTSTEQFLGKPEESPMTSQVGAVWAWTTNG
jgi:hypothetical protein